MLQVLEALYVVVYNLHNGIFVGESLWFTNIYPTDAQYDISPVQFNDTAFVCMQCVRQE